MLNKFFDNTLRGFFCKKVLVPKNLIFEYYVCKHLKIITFFNKNSLCTKYFVLPDFLDFIFYKNILYFKVKEINFNINLLSSFFNGFFIEIQKLKVIEFKTIIVRGIGIKISFLDSLNCVLKLKLGYSHFIYLNICNGIKVSLFKKKVLVQSFKQAALGNFCMLLKKCRPINVFTGKGLWIKGKRKFKLKEYTKKI